MLVSLILFIFSLNLKLLENLLSVDVREFAS